MRAFRRHPFRLHEAAATGDADLVARLISEAGDPDALLEGRTALHLAADIGDPERRRRPGTRGPETIRVLLAAGADPSRRDPAGRTPIAIACGAWRSEDAGDVLEALASDPRSIDADLIASRWEPLVGTHPPGHRHLRMCRWLHGFDGGREVGPIPADADRAWLATAVARCADLPWSMRLLGALGTDP